MSSFTLSRITSAIPVAALTAVILATSVAHAKPDTSDWGCEFCPFDSGYHGEYEAGISAVNDDSARFGNASGYDEEGTYLNLDGEGGFADEGYRMSWLIEDLGLDSRHVEVKGGQQGHYDYRLDYRELPQHVFDSTRTVFQQPTGDVLSLPPGWVNSGATSEFSALAASLMDRDIESERKTLQIGGRYMPSSRYRLSAEYRHQARDGIDITGGAYFTQSSLLPRPFDYETDELDVSLRFIGDNARVKLSYYASLFENINRALNWENPFTSPAGGEFARQAQAPDNNFQQISLSASYRFAAFDTILAFNGAGGRVEQDDDLLPYTSNLQLSAGALPRTRLDAELQTRNYGLRLTSRPHDRIRLKAAYRFDERDNTTPVESWTRVMVDSFNSGQAETNTPYSFERSRFNLSGDFDVLKTVRLSGGYDRTEHERDFQEVAEQTEETGWGKVRWRPNALISLEIKGGAEERDVDRYDEALAATLGQNPLLRKYNLAYRYREFGELSFAASLPRSPVSLTGSVLYANDDYSQSLLGITEGEDVSAAADLSWSISKNASLHAFGSYEDIEADQSGSEQFATVDWRATNNDSFYTFGAGIRLRRIWHGIDLDLDYTRSDGNTEIKIDSASGGDSRFPDLESQLDSLRARLTWRRTERQEFTFRLQYERFEADDWALQDVGPATVPAVLSLDAQPYDYDVLLIGIGFRYFIGERTPMQTDEE